MASIRNSRGGLSAAEVLTPVWRGHVADLRFWETEIRARQPESVHRFRVATRRLRSNLSAFEPLLDTTSTRGLQDGLRQAAAAVGGIRDDEIVRERIERLSVDGAGPGVAATVPLLTRILDRARIVSWQQGLAYLDSPAHDTCARSLDAFSDLPPWLPDAWSSAEQTLAPFLDSEWSRVRNRARSALGAPDPGSRIHSTRKAAKRTRYVAEALIPVLGTKAQRLGKVAERVQTVLGEYQDCVVVQAFLDEVPHEESLGVDQLRVLQTMREVERARAAARRADFERLILELDRPPRGR